MVADESGAPKERTDKVGEDKENAEKETDAAADKQESAEKGDDKEEEAREDGKEQVWSLSSFEVSRQLLTNDLNQVSSVSLLMTSSTALANEGLFELTLCPSLTRAMS